MKLKENVYYYVDNNENKLIIRYGTKMYIISDEDEKYYNMLRIGNPNKELFEFLYSKNLIDNFTTDSSFMNNRTYQYLRNRAKSTFNDSIFFKNILYENTIMIIGCGGIGTVVLDNLLRAEFSNFILVDNDFVENTNLNRQLFYDIYDIGKSKVDVLYNKIHNSFDFNVEINKYNQKVTSINDLYTVTKNIDLQKLIIINCADTPINLDNIIGDFCIKNNIPFISGYVGVESGTVGPIYDNKNVYTPSDNCENKKLLGSIGTNNMITGALLAQVVVDYMFKEIFHNKVDFYK